MESATHRSPARVRVGSFELDLRSGELRSLTSDRPADKVLIREQPFQVLRMLVEREGKIVTRDEMRKKLWPNDTVVDFDHSINVAIGELRRAFGDSAANARYIETLSRRGYRLVAPVEWLESEASVVDDDGGVAAEESQPAPPLGDLTGRTVSHYRVLEVVGGGGMGLVYEAEDLRLGRRAALKFLPQELASDPVALKRLEREAQTASALNHPNICTIYDIDEYTGQRFIAMELLEGETLEQRLAASAPDPLPPLTLIGIAIQVCAGLEAAHGKDIVHRDIKPGNLFLTNQGTVKLLDFGIAKQLDTAEVVDAVTADASNVGSTDTRSGLAGAASQPSLTRTGATVGTSGYMSPEQVRKERLDGRSDLFSLGLVIYEMATGRRAFTGETAVAVQEAILTRTPEAAESVKSDVPRALAAILDKALQKDRALRYQSASDLGRALDTARSELVRPRASRTRRWLLAAAVFAIAATAAVWITSPRSPRVTLAPDDTLVLSDLANATDDRALDDAVYTALRIGLEQTPYLNVLANDKLQGALTALRVEPGARITPDIALEVCRHTESRIVVASAVAEEGNRLAVVLQGIDCRSGSVFSRVEEAAASRDGVVAALGSAALKLRRDLGEPPDSIARYDVPLAEATSSSPDALELLRVGYRRQLVDVDAKGAIAYYQRAAQTDPDFALALAALSSAHANLGDNGLAAAAARKAYALRDRMTAPARFQVESTYLRDVVGDLDSECSVNAQWVTSFPHDVIARNNLGLCLMRSGELDRGLGHFREAARLRPTALSYHAWIQACLLTGRFDEAQTTMDDALRRGFESRLLRDLQVRLAFHRKDDAAMQRLWTEATGTADEWVMLLGKASVDVYYGRLRAALRSEEEAAKLAAAAGASWNGALTPVYWQVEVGLTPLGPITVMRDQALSERFKQALILARAGRLEEARQAAGALSRDFPTHTQVQMYGLPLINGAIALGSNDGTAALAALEPAARFDLAFTNLFEDLYLPYLRGLAHLQAGKAALAVADFQKILDHPGHVGRSLLMPLAMLQLARAQRAMGADAVALDSYEAFLELWQDADADIPIYSDAKAEHEELRTRSPAGSGPR